MTRIIIIGCGDIGRRVARLEQSAGNVVTALTRSEESARRLRALGIEPISGDLDVPNTLTKLPAEDAWIYYFAPPPDHGITDPRLQAVVANLKKENLPARAVLISTTGVYGDCRGEWVTEERPPNPQADRAKRRLAAETILRSWSEKNNVTSVILRVPGIYGPDRLPEKRLRAGEPVVRAEESPFSNRIHADDLARACMAAMRRGRAGAIYNVSDGHPTTMTDFFYGVADLLKIARPPAISLQAAQQRLGADILSYLAESKRIDNRRLREELGIELKYPDLASGLAACVKKF
ncbi:MAG: SDR family oxidoreductase [Gammaproteobacteria bacterium]|nr:SDR family oxidoreductase [Gammaproteobacteria bacterium]